MKKLYLIGGGGHCHSCIDVIELEGKFSIKGIFDKKEKIGTNVFGYNIIGSDDDILSYVEADNYFLITVGQIKTAKIRISIFEKLKNANANIAQIISPRSYVSPRAKLGDGCIVFHDVLINAGSEVGENCIINSKSLIEHDVEIGSHCHISTAAVINGNCKIENECFIGSNAVLKEGVVVLSNSIIQAGSFYRGK